MKILITGIAGFIGYHLAIKCLEEKYEVLGIDNLNNYYDVNLKKKRIEELHKKSLSLNSKFKFTINNIEDYEKIEKIYKKFKPNCVVHLAAQAGVRYSLENPLAYINTNLLGFGNLIELSKKYKVDNFLYASSSSVYGGNTKIPFSENDSVNHPVSLYAATKRSNELIAHSYSHLYGISSTGMRFFTVYGPLGRPDMAPMIFADAIINKKTLKIFNHGIMSRSFTFIDDVINIIIKLVQKPAIADKSFNSKEPNSSSSWCPNRIVNIGNDNAVGLLTFINMLEKELGLEAIKDFENLQKGDVVNTSSDNSIINEWLGTCPKTSLNKGIKVFVNWYKDYYK